jgi:uncharacterized protein YggE
MKQLFVAIMALCITIIGFSQANNNPFPRTINVTGSAELEIIPDEIYLQIDLTEYDKKGIGKVAIDQIKQRFLVAMQGLGLTEKEVSLNNASGYNHEYWYLRKRKKENPDMKATVSYWVKVKTPQQIDQVVNKLDDEATSNFFIAKVTHSKLKDYREQLKIEAIKAAKIKAEKLAGAVNEKVGVAVTINEPSEQAFEPQPRMYPNAIMKLEDNAGFADPGIQVDFKKIKLHFEVLVVFALQ